MKFFKENKITAAVLIIVVLGAIWYFFFFKKDVPELDTGLTTFGVSEVLVANQQFISLFGELQQIDLDVSIFNDSYFNSLVDFSQPISERRVGRENPFAPI